MAERSARQEKGDRAATFLHARSCSADKLQAPAEFTLFNTSADVAVANLRSFQNTRVVETREKKNRKANNIALTHVTRTQNAREIRVVLFSRSYAVITLVNLVKGEEEEEEDEEEEKRGDSSSSL